MAWLVSLGIDTVAMESTGIYWVPIYDLLEQHGITPYLVNVRHVKIVPGRKSDWNDAQWLQKLHMLGLLHGSFRPDAEILALRTLVRYRAEVIQHRAPHILHMQKALLLMNLHLSVVLRDITGVTGQAIMRAMVAGERDAARLAALRNPACKASAEITKALTGTWQAEQLFVLQQALSLFDHYTERIVACDAEIERLLAAMKSRGEDDAPLPDLPDKGKSKTKNAPAASTRAQLARIVGIDLVAITGLSASSVQTILAEIGTDMTRFPTVKHFCSWLGLAPHNDISGGKVLRSRTMKVVNRAAQAFRQAAQSVSSFQHRVWRLFPGHAGAQRATTGGGRNGTQAGTDGLFDAAAPGNHSTKRARTPMTNGAEREIRQLARRAKKLGYTLTEAMPAPRRPRTSAASQEGFLGRDGRRAAAHPRRTASPAR